MSLKGFDSEDILISSDLVSTPIWSGDLEILTAENMVTSSTQKNGYTGTYYLDIYDKAPEENTEVIQGRVQFAIAYGNKNGGGSEPYDTEVPGNSPSKTVYGQYRSLVLGDEESDFTFGYGSISGSVESEDIYALTVDRARFKEKLRPGTLELKLGLPEGKEIVLKDNSNQIQSVRYIDSGRVYELVKDLGNNETSYGPSGSYGYMLPDIGVILLNSRALVAEGLNVYTGSARTNSDTQKTNVEVLYEALTSGSHFKVQSEETVTSNYIFVRARNAEFNYSTNPSNITGSGELRHEIMVMSPQSYITTVGLYNSNNDLLAVAKLSRPLVKDFTKEALIRIKLDY